MVRISDLQLIELLERYGRMPYLTLAKRLGVSEAAIRKRIKKLENVGAIERFTVDIKPKKIGFDIQVLIGIDTKPEKYAEIMEWLKEHNAVKKMYSSSGDHMLMLECWFRNTAEFMQFNHELSSKDGILKACPAIIHERIK